MSVACLSSSLPAPSLLYSGQALGAQQQAAPGAEWQEAMSLGGCVLSLHDTDWLAVR